MLDSTQQTAAERVGVLVDATLRRLAGLDALTAERARAHLRDLDWPEDVTCTWLEGVLFGVEGDRPPTADEAVAWCESHGWTDQPPARPWDASYDLEHEPGTMWLTFASRPDKSLLAEVKKFGFRAVYGEAQEDVSRRRRYAGTRTKMRKQFQGWRLELYTSDAVADFEPSALEGWRAEDPLTGQVVSEW